ncbi:MAG: aldehyde dehydrogenase family protein [Alcaligenaceae bacterium]|nr:aldehyde dehydrogenase family protein [Alcaligenaceae bacterium]
MWNMSDYQTRLERLNRLEKAMHAYRNDMLEALKVDLNKSEFEAELTEVALSFSMLSDTKAKLKKWMKPKSVRTPLSLFPARSFIVPSPLGRVLIMSPWNYPIQLVLVPLITALAAGNRVVLKPSSTSSATFDVLSRMIESVFNEDEVKVLVGGHEESNELLKEPWDLIFFTGSPTIGQMVYEAAAKTLSPVVLELGGKSPVVVDETADITLAAKRIMWGKLLNAGQTCVAPDYVFVHHSKANELKEALEKAVVRLYGEDPLHHEAYPAIINQHHFERLKSMSLPHAMMDETTRKIAPQVIPATVEHPLMKDEIFGPLLPLITYKNLTEVESFIKSRPHPLACYVFSEDSEIWQRLIYGLQFGGGCVNDVVIHLANEHLPFGGIGHSGIGSYHGEQGFKTFSHYKSIVKRPNFLDIPIRYKNTSPYVNWYLAIVKRLLK